MASPGAILTKFQGSEYIKLFLPSMSEGVLEW